MKICMRLTDYLKFGNSLQKDTSSSTTSTVTLIVSFRYLNSTYDARFFVPVFLMKMISSTVHSNALFVHSLTPLI